VPKRAADERIGVAVVVRDGLLFVKDVSPEALFANTRLEVNDVVLSINGINFQFDPDVEAAIRAVQNSKSTVTFVVRKRIGAPIEL
jgi:C-terminal processing protease CtpA/Prc